MAKDLQDLSSVGGAVPPQTGKNGGEAKKRKRNQYNHKMTVNERFALQTVQRAQAALKVVNEAIKSGKPVSAEVVDLCFTFSREAGKMLFATT